MNELNLFGKTMIDIAIERIVLHQPKDEYYVAFSGGKDSIVMYDLVKKAKVKYQAYCNFTTVDPPELIQFIKNNYPEVMITKPEKTMWQLIIENKVPPTRIMRYCCRYLKERGGIGKVVITGVRRKESSRRSHRPIYHQCSIPAFNKMILNPIIDWTEKDVWNYIKFYKLPYPDLYDKGFKRIGCIGCPMNPKDQKKDFEIYPKFRRAYILAFEKMLKKRIETGMITEWKTGEEVMAWWVNNISKQQKQPVEDTLF